MPPPPTRLQSAPPDRAASPRGTGEAPRRTSSRSVGRDRCLLPPRVAACATTARRPPPSTTPSFAQIRCPPPASSTSADTCAQPRCPPRRSGLPRSIDRRRPAPRRPRLRTRAALPPSLPHQRGPSFPNIQSLRYVPSFLPPSFAKEPEKKKEEERPKEKEKGKPRVIDKFLEELKFPQEQREKHIQDRDHRHEGHHSDNSTPSSQFDELLDEFDLTGKFPRSFDDGDRQTTNLYVDENFLLRTFARFGTIASGKIMWPRTEEERRRQRNCGFVAFTNRADGQAAKDEMQGVVVYDYELKIGWGKSVALPSQALPAPPGHMAIRNKEVASFVLS
ncbi:hypothetical protein BS78_K174800 [Paspalum vaginatum]|uniref:RRM domain-containing protein n=1 Tax=Paspalum vaginatum TaxID=158149 RepID=A0A9W7X8L8_9POAL|nr:hypothetical protein BS78_K174800 [Paspalum vaginatum]